MKLPQDWHEASEEQAWLLGDKLNQAIGRDHILSGCRLRVVAHRHRVNIDELLCWHPEAEDLFTLVHLAWALTSTAVNATPPVVKMHGCFRDFLSYESVLESPLHCETGLLKDAEIRGESRGLLLGKQQGISIGEKRGMAVGERQGQIRILTRQLCRRFQTTPTEVIARVHCASTGQLEQWADNILTAQTLEQVFDSEEAHNDL